MHGYRIGVPSTSPTIATRRLVLRQWRPQDKEPFAELNADPDVMEHFPHTLSRSQSDDMLDRVTTDLAENGRGLWATEVEETGTFIGFIGLNAPRFDTAFTPCIEVGWRLARHAWGKGYASEGATAVLAFAFGFGQVELPNDEIVSFTTEANMRSRRVMDKIGLIHDPTRDFDHPLFPDWSGRRHVLCAVRRDRWEAEVRVAM